MLVTAALIRGVCKDHLVAAGLEDVTHVVRNKHFRDRAADKLFIAQNLVNAVHAAQLIGKIGEAFFGKGIVHNDEVGRCHIEVFLQAVRTRNAGKILRKRIKDRVVNGSL